MGPRYGHFQLPFCSPWHQCIFSLMKFLGLIFGFYSCHVDEKSEFGYTFHGGTLGGSPLDSSKLIILITFEPLWVCQAIGNILTSIVSNSNFGKRPGVRDLTIFSSDLFPMSPTIYFLIDCFFVSRAQAISNAFLLFLLLWVINQNLDTPPTESGPGQNLKWLSAAAADLRLRYHYTGVPLLLSIVVFLRVLLKALLMECSLPGDLPSTRQT